MAAKRPTKRPTQRPASQRVRNAIEAGWTPVLDGHGACSDGYLGEFRGRGPHRFFDVRAGDRHVQVYVSPTGRSVRVFVDGTEVKP